MEDWDGGGSSSLIHQLKGRDGIDCWKVVVLAGHSYNDDGPPLDQISDIQVLLPLNLMVHVYSLKFPPILLLLLSLYLNVVVLDRK